MTMAPVTMPDERPHLPYACWCALGRHRDWGDGIPREGTISKHLIADISISGGWVTCRKEGDIIRTNGTSLETAWDVHRGLSRQYIYRQARDTVWASDDEVARFMQTRILREADDYADIPTWTEEDIG